VVWLIGGLICGDWSSRGSLASFGTHDNIANNAVMSLCYLPFKAAKLSVRNEDFDYYGLD
jgi:hypothetical protein